MSKHTKGAWSIPAEMNSNLFGEAVSIKILDKNGFPIAGLDCRPILHNWGKKFPKMRHWAEGADSGKTQIDRSVKEMDANAKLIASAPELLEALESCYAICSGENLSKSCLIDALSKAKKAISKARGEQS